VEESKPLPGAYELPKLLSISALYSGLVGPDASSADSTPIENEWKASCTALPL
jgi:hypothetical protein